MHKAKTFNEMIQSILRESTKASDRVVPGAKPGELFTDFRHPKGKAVVTGKGKVVAIYRTERAALKHAETGKPVKEWIEPNSEESEIIEAKASTKADSSAKARYKQAVIQWKQGMEQTQKKIDFLESTLASDKKRLAEAEARAAAGDYSWGTRELWKDSWGM
jgi:hypothetical protein